MPVSSQILASRLLVGIAIVVIISLMQTLNLFQISRGKITTRDIENIKTVAQTHVYRQKEKTLRTSMQQQNLSILDNNAFNICNFIGHKVKHEEGPMNIEFIITVTICEIDLLNSTPQ